MAGEVGLEPTMDARRWFWRPVLSPLSDSPIYGADAQDRTETIQKIGRLSKPLRYHYATSALEIKMLLT